MLKVGEADFPQFYRGSYRDHCNGVFYLGREIGLNSKYSMGKWEFTAREQNGGQRMKIY